MNVLMKAFSRRVSVNFQCLARNHHQTTSRIRNLKLDVEIGLASENITSLVQKTIIPLNRVPLKPSILDKPCLDIVGKIDSSLPVKVDIVPSKEILDPGNVQEKKAHRMLRIKRKKMNKHKYKKKQKKYRYQHMRIQRERFAKREAKFRNEIYGLLRDAQAFDAEQYVNSKLEMYRTRVWPNRIHGCRMPHEVVKEFLERRELRKQRLLEKMERRKQMLAERGSLSVDKTS